MYIEYLFQRSLGNSIICKHEVVFVGFDLGENGGDSDANSNLREESPDIRRCRLKSGRPACFAQKASHCKRWSNMVGDPRHLFFFSLLYISSVSNKMALAAMSLAIKDANEACWPALLEVSRPIFMFDVICDTFHRRCHISWPSQNCFVEK